MDDKGKKPSLIEIIAASKKPKGVMGAADESGGYSPSPECVEAVRHFFEAGSDGDYEGAAQALATANKHLPAAGEGEEESLEVE